MKKIFNWFLVVMLFAVLSYGTVKPAPYQFVVMWVDEGIVEPTPQYSIYGGVVIQDAIEAFESYYGQRTILSVCRLDTNKCPLPTRTGR